MEENVAQKFAVLLGRHESLLFAHCARSFSWIYYQATLWGGYEITMLT